MEVVDIAEQINKRIAKLEKLCGQLDDADKFLAETEANYDKEYAKAQARLAMGKIEEIDGVAISKPPATLIGKYAAGICFEEKCQMLIAKNRVKSLHKKIDALSASISAKQSIYRQLSHEKVGQY